MLGFLLSVRKKETFDWKKCNQSRKLRQNTSTDGI